MSNLNANIFRSAILRTNLPESFVLRQNPSLFYFPGVTSRPWWFTSQQTGDDDRWAKKGLVPKRYGYDPLPLHKPVWNDNSKPSWLKYLESKTDVIQDEYMQLNKELPDTSDYDLSKDRSQQQQSNAGEHAMLHKGDWRWMSFVQKGIWQSHIASRCPKTAEILSNIPGLMVGTPFSFTFFSILAPGASITPHTAPMNLRLRIHLPLKVPKIEARKPGKKYGIEVAGLIQPWEKGNALVFDDSFLHAAYNETDEERVVLLIDIWHPEIHPDERELISQMFATLPKQGS